MRDKAALIAIIRDLAERHRTKLGEEAIAEMAVPSYTRGYFFSRYVFWRKLDWVIRLAECTGSEVILDFGCGTGVLLPTWSESAKRVFATDLQMQVAIDLAARLSLRNVEFIQPDQLGASIPDGALDRIIAANVLEHVDDRLALLAVFARKLKHDGKLIVSGPTEGKLYRLGRRIVGFSGHYHVTNIKGVVADVLKSGFQILRRRRWPVPGPGCLYQIFSFGRA